MALVLTAMHGLLGSRAWDAMHGFGTDRHVWSIMQTACGNHPALLARNCHSTHDYKCARCNLCRMMRIDTFYPLCVFLYA